LKPSVLSSSINENEMNSFVKPFNLSEGPLIRVGIVNKNALIRYLTRRLEGCLSLFYLLGFFDFVSLLLEALGAAIFFN